MHEVKFIPNPMQKQFIESRAKADLFSSRMGEGKSAGLAWCTFYHSRHNPGARWAVVRDTYENMRATTMKTFFEWFPPGVFGNFNHSTKTFAWYEGIGVGNAEVEFLGMDAPDDVNKLMSRELGGIAFDEPAPAVGSAGIDEMIFDVALGSRLRQRGMKWYACKLAENNPDEDHWTYRKFVNPGMPGHRLWQPPEPENVQNLPPEYYADMRRTFAHRPDLIRRFVEGEFGFQQIGKAVTPQWSDKLHLGIGLVPILRQPLELLWDWGHNPTCIITQKTPLGSWQILDAVVGEDIGAEELVVNAIVPLLQQKYPRFKLGHIGDPAGKQREQTSILRSPVRVVRKALGGHFRPGPVSLEGRIEPLRAALGRLVGGRGLVRVDKLNAAAVHHALRGGWHFAVTRGGITSGEPVKNIHSHPGDAMGYGAAVLFPIGRRGLAGLGINKLPEEAGGYFGRSKVRPGIGPGPTGLPLPKHGSGLRDDTMVQSPFGFGGNKDGS